MHVIPVVHVICCFDIHYEVAGARGECFGGITQYNINDDTHMDACKDPASLEDSVKLSAESSLEIDISGGEADNNFATDIEE